MKKQILSFLLAAVMAVTISFSARASAGVQGENNVRLHTRLLSLDSKYLQAAIRYPQLSGLGDAAVQNAINDILKQSAVNALEEGRNNAADMAQAIREGYTGVIGMCQTFYDFIIAYNRNGLMSIVLTSYQYSGGAHGGTTASSYTFDLKTGRVLTLEDMMDDSADYASVINATIRKEIDRRTEIGIVFEYERKFSDIGPTPDWYLSSDSIVFYFQEYEYFPYASGIQEFDVRYKKLDGMFDKYYAFLASGRPMAVPTLKTGNLP